MTTDEKDFLSRWSRRKQAVREGHAEPEPESASVPAESADAAASAPEADEEAADESAYADVDFDALDYSSDYTRFMGKDVPEMIKRRALRALWRSDPILANVDGLNDYDDDFTDAAMVMENLASSYRTGHGYRSDEEIAALEEERKVEDGEAAEARAKAEESGEPVQTESGGDAGEEPGEAPETQVAEAEEEHPTPDDPEEDAKT